jgi:DNA-binding response OmpR family regulator
MAPTHAAQEDNTTAKVILIVEDDNAIGEFIIQVIQQETPYQAIHFADGYEAWTRIRNQRMLPNLLILDYNLPAMTGVEFYDRLHANKEYEHIPALIVSAYPRLCQEAAKVRNLACLEKPFAIDALLDMIEKLIV